MMQWVIEDECIFKRLERILVNQPISEVHHLGTSSDQTGFDHALLHMTCNSIEERPIKPLQFLNFLSKHNHFKKIVADNWSVDFVGNPFIEFQAKMQRVKKALSTWEKNLMEMSLNKFPPWKM